MSTDQPCLGELNLFVVSPAGSGRWSVWDQYHPNRLIRFIGCMEDAHLVADALNKRLTIGTRRVT